MCEKGLVSRWRRLKEGGVGSRNHHEFSRFLDESRAKEGGYNFERTTYYGKDKVEEVESVSKRISNRIG
jgi:hypothetical protein